MKESASHQRIPLYLNGRSGEPDGYCKLVEAWGSDERIIESARMSTDGAFRGWGERCSECKQRVIDVPGDRSRGIIHGLDCSRPGTEPGDEKLLRYLWTNQHATPFEFCGMTVEMQVPLFVRSQIHRHRAAGYNELSARYTEMPEAFWLPSVADIRKQGGANKQGSVGGMEQIYAQEAVTIMAESYRRSRQEYERLLALDVAKEQARAVLPVGQMTRFRMTTNLRMWTHFLGLRLDAHAQPETRVVAEACAGFLRSTFPRTMAIFDEGRAA